MAQKSGNHVKPPVTEENDTSKMAHKTKPDNLTDQHHGESTNTWQADKRIGQHNQAGRPPLMKK